MPSSHGKRDDPPMRFSPACNFPVSIPTTLLPHKFNLSVERKRTKGIHQKPSKKRVIIH